MIPGVFAAGAMGQNGPLPAASFVAASGADYVSGTSINSPTTPAGIQDGDAVYAVVFSRSTLTPPSGWTIVDSQSNSDPNTGTNQTLHVYRKNTVTAGNSSTAYAWNQAVSGRMGLAYVVLRSSSGALVDVEVKKAAQGFGADISFDTVVPHVVAEKHGEIVVVAATAISAAAATPDTWTAPSGETLDTTATQMNNRLAVAHSSRNRGEGNSSPINMTTLAAPLTNYTAVIVIRIRPNDASTGSLAPPTISSGYAVTVEP